MVRLLLQTFANLNYPQNRFISNIQFNKLIKLINMSQKQEQMILQMVETYHL